MGELLRNLSARHGARTAVAGERSQLSFAELDRAAGDWARAFAAAGLGKGSHVGLLAANGPEWLAVAFGVWRAGATLVPISTFVTVRELGELLHHADVNALVLQPRLRSHDYLGMLRELPKSPALRTVVVLDEDALPPYQSAAQFLGAADPACSAGFRLDPEATACILYTSGTTGRPKGVMLSHRAILSTVWPTAERSGLTGDDSLLSTLPLFWVAGLVIRALPTLAAGCALLLIETFSVDAVLEALRRNRPTALHLRPPQVGQILAHPRFRPEMLAEVRKGNGRTEWYGSSLHADSRFITGYGMTEMAGYVTALHWRDPADVRRQQHGDPLPGVQIRIVDSDGTECPSGHTGEIRVRGPGMFTGYYKEQARAGLDSDGWFMTGDLGRMGKGGTLHFAGRSKDLLRCKGINVSPLEVEAVLSACPGVEAAYVVGLPFDGLEQRLVALIIARDGAHVAEDELRAVAAEALSHYKRPQEYVFIERSDIALSATSKPQREELARLASSRVSLSGEGNPTEAPGGA